MTSPADEKRVNLSPKSILIINTLPDDSQNYCMKPKILVILFGVIFSSFSNEILDLNDFSEKSGKILLIQYETEQDFIVQKDYTGKKKKYFYIHGTSPTSSVTWNSDKRILYVDEPINMSDSSKLIFFDNDILSAISLPFQYSDITLDSFINDSIIQFTLNNKKNTLQPGQEYIDSITSIKTEGKRVIQYNTKFYVKNHGFVLKKNIITEKERMDKLNKELRIRDSIDIIDLENMDKRK